MAAHCTQLGQVELQPDHEHQEHHTEFAEVADAFGLLGQRQCIGADDHAHREVPQHRGQFERAAGHHAQHSGQQVQQRQLKRTHPCIVGPLTATTAASVRA
jgi:hypothetical protein